MDGMIVIGRRSSSIVFAIAVALSLLYPGAGRAQVPTDFNGPVSIQGAPVPQAALQVDRAPNQPAVVDLYSHGDGGDHMRFFSPDPTKGDVLRTYINEAGAIYTNAWMVISGALTDYTSPTPDDLHPTGDSFMLGIWSDVLGPALAVRPSNEDDPTLATMDSAGNYRLAILADGSLVFADSGSNQFANSSWDTILHRVGPGQLQTDGNFSAAGLSDTPSLITLLNNSQVSITSGAVLIIDTTADRAFVPSQLSGDIKVVGIANQTIAAGASGMVLTRGIARVNVLGPVARGDLLITSNTTGYAQSVPLASTPVPGSIIGKALAATANGTDQIDVLVTL